MNINQKIIMWN